VTSLLQGQDSSSNAPNKRMKNCPKIPQVVKMENQMIELSAEEIGKNDTNDESTVGVTYEELGMNNTNEDNMSNAGLELCEIEDYFDGPQDQDVEFIFIDQILDLHHLWRNFRFISNFRLFYWKHMCVKKLKYYFRLWFWGWVFLIVRVEVPSVLPLIILLLYNKIL